MVKFQVVAGPVADQHIAVDIQNIATGRPDTGDGGVGGQVVHLFFGIYHLHGVELEGKKSKHQRHQDQQHAAAESGYSFHVSVSPPSLPMDIKMG